MPLLRRLLLLAGPLTAGLSAGEYHVAVTGSDSNPGTAVSPWKTIQKAAATVVAGDVVNIHPGTYAERVTLSGKSGTATLPIIFQRNPDDTDAVIISQDGVTPPNGQSAILTVQNCDHLLLNDLEISNYKTSGTAVQQRAQLPAGIYVTGSGDGIELHRCKVHDIWQSSTTLNNYDANGFGIAIYGTAATPIDHLVIDSCEVWNLRTGASESVTVNGNVTNFAVTGNTVHDCNNIGIDFIGFEGTNSNAALDQARSGVCSGNTVYRIDSKFNPVYGGNFTTGGADSTRSAPGLYVDGGRDILIERNLVYDCNFGLSAGSEHQNKIASGITVRDNIFHHCHVGGIVTGGSETTNGGLTTSSFTNNTLWGNDTASQGGGQFSIQHYVSSTTIQRNLIAAPVSFAQLVVKGDATGTFAAGAIDWNLYAVSPTSDIEFVWQGTSYNTFATWKTASGADAHSSFITSSPGLVEASPTVASPASGFFLTAASPARDTGDSAALPYIPPAGERDWASRSRIANGRVDIGAIEYMTPLQSWRDRYFALPDGGPGAGPNDDPDGDGRPNLVEYTQGTNPLAVDASPLPALSMTATGALRFSYRRDAADAAYSIETSTAFDAWTVAPQTEQTDGNGLYWRDISPGPAPVAFFRLKISIPSW